MNGAGPMEGVNCFDEFQQKDIQSSFYMTSDESDNSSISNAFKSENSVEECKFTGTNENGFDFKFAPNEW